MAYDIQTWANVAAFVGGGMCMGVGAIGAAVGEGYTAAEANLAISRNTKMAGDIFKSMLIGQAIAESASIFALVIAMILLFTKFSATSYVTVCAILSAGLAMGFGAIGSGIGAGFPAGAACVGMSRQPALSGKLTTNMLIGSAVCQTPSIFALVVAFILLFTDFSAYPVSPAWAAMLGSGLAIGLGAIGSGIGGGIVAKSSSEGIARQPLTITPVTNVMLLGQAIAQTPAILGLLISFILIYKGFPATDKLAPSMALLGAGICMASSGGVKAIARNQELLGVITRSMLVGMAVAESTAIYAMVIALVMIFVA
jgi:F0F1-type ATP synthase membrane subunit c/vacuolar-type H+-ATPase subunit K